MVTPLQPAWCCIIFHARNFSVGADDRRLLSGFGDLCVLHWVSVHLYQACQCFNISASVRINFITSSSQVPKSLSVALTILVSPLFCFCFVLFLGSGNRDLALRIAAMSVAIFTGLAFFLHGIQQGTFCISLSCVKYTTPWRGGF